METVEVVIKIPKDMYERTLCTGVVIVGIDAAYIGGAIIDGTVLPKGHGDLKDYNAIISRYSREVSIMMSEGERLDLLCGIVDDVPTVIEADREADNG